MAEYIKRSKAIKALGEEPMVWTDDDSLIQEYADWVKHVDAIKAIPAADVVEVVRCKDCKWFNQREWECKSPFVSTDCEGGAQYSINFEPDDFCSYGERKEK